jgi:uncharacterized protein (TIGR04222 family)
VTPSAEIDEVWHLHLVHSRDYWDIWCADVLRRRLHHGPTRGGASEAARYRTQYAATMALYEQWFGPPPEAYWPGTHTRFRATPRFRTVDLDRVLVLPRPRMPGRRLATLVLAAVATTAGASPARADLPLNPLDWDGASFLLLYACLLGGAIVVTLALRLLLRRTAHGADTERLSWFELAYLAGGEMRAFDAAMAELLARAAVRFDPETRSVTASAFSGYLPPFLSTIRRSLTPRASHRRLVRDSDEAFGQVRDTLVSRGLILASGQSWQVGFITAAVPVLVGLFGCAKIQVGVSRGRPVGDLTFLVVVTFVLAFVFLLSRPLRTSSGDTALRQYKDYHARAMRAPLDGELALAVALVGTAVLAGTAYAEYARFAAAGSSGGDGGGDSGGDGGGGDGGGGCGGCSS